MSWVSFLKDRSEELREKTAIIDQGSGRRLSYSELWRESTLWASYLKDQGVKKGDRVTLLANNRLEHLTVFFGSAILGAQFVPLNFRLAKGELEEISKRVAPRLALIESENIYQSDCPQVLMDQITLPSNGQTEITESSLDDPLLMLFTSGSTGTPKGVMLHGRMLETNQQMTCEQWGLLASDRTIVETPFFHTGGYNVLCLPLLWKGGTSVLAKGFDVDNLVSTIQSEKLSVYFGVPTMFQMIAEHDKFQAETFPSVRFLISGGAACPVPMMKKYQELGLMFKQGFGLTEVGPNCFLLDEKDSIRKAGSIGKPMPHSRVKVITDEGKIAEANEPGELLLSGDHVCLGYFEDEERFSEAMFDGYFRTGDLVQYDEEGFFYVVGRLKDMYISGGENVYPGEVEKAILKMPGVDEAIVVAVESDKWGEVGYLFLKSEKNYQLEDIREFLGPHLSRYKHPHYVELVSEYPLLGNGKINKNELKNIASKRKGTLSA